VKALVFVQEFAKFAQFAQETNVFNVEKLVTESFPTKNVQSVKEQVYPKKAICLSMIKKLFVDAIKKNTWKERTFLHVETEIIKKVPVLDLK